MKKSLFIAGLSGLLIPSAVANQTQDSITSDFINQVPAYDLTHALQDRLTGIDFENPDVRPGTLLSMNIRGLRDYSLNSNPLIILNGIPYHYADCLLDIDPADIVSIQILKDATTAALYGGQARHGAILINTRPNRAHLEQTHVTYEGYVAAKTPSFRYPLMNAEQLKQYRNEMGIDPSYNETTSRDIDRQDIYETAWTNRHRLSLSTGWKSGYIQAGIGLTNDASIMPIDNYRRYTMHADLHQNIGSYASLDISAYYADATTTHSYGNDNSSGSYWLTLSPFSNDTVYEEELHKKYSEMRTNTLYQSWSANVVCPWIEGLSYHFEGGYSSLWGKYGHRESIWDESSKNYYDSWKSIWDESSKNYYDSWKSESNKTFQLNLVHRVSYEKNWKDIHHFKLSSKYSCEKLTAKDYYGEGRDVIDGRFTQLYSVHYDYQKKYEVDWCTNLEQYKYIINEISYSKKFDWKGSHSLHLQWNIHQEPFAQGWTWMNLLSLRADQGLIRTPQILNFGDKDYSYYRSYNMGIDFQLWQGRLSGAFDLYKQRNGNILETWLLPDTAAPGRDDTWKDSMGVKTENRGWELSLQGTVIDHLNGWTWQLGLGLYANHNKLILNNSHWRDGLPIRSYKEVIYDGIYNEGDPDCTPDNLGSIRAKGYSEGVNIEDILHTYSLDPDLKGFFSSNIRWKNIYLNLTGAFQVGGYTYSNFYEFFAMMQTQGNKPNLDLWTPTHTSGRFPSCYKVSYSTSLNWYDASMCRIRNITLGFNIPDKWTSRIGLERLNIWASVNNPFILHSDLYDELGIDPATNAIKDAKSGGYGWYPQYTPMPYVGMKYPSTRDYLIGLNITL
ncbi:MAG: TonB-dependent receptor plug domain-containing protein [Bacteroidales bacterium]|nr:TonB-dependent receptor plug domain-containing protein [Bacteroidales bacterium]